jgi:predicted Zn-dependent peptidase
MNKLIIGAFAFAMVVSCAKKGAEPETSPAGETPTPDPKAKTDPKNTPDPKATKTEVALATDLPPIPDSESWRKDLPQNVDEETPRLPAFESSKLKNGLTVIVPSEKSQLPLISLQLVTRGGAALDTPDKAGLASLVYGMLGEGAGNRDALKFSDAVADLGAQFGAASDRDRGSVSIGGLSRHADAMTALLADAALRPRMADKDFARRKEQQIAGLIASRGSPDGLAFQAIPALLYGKDHPYGHPPTGTPDTVKTISIADLKAALPKVIAPERSALVVAGNLSLDAAVKLAEKHFGKWKSGTSVMAEIKEVSAAPRAQVFLIDKKGAPQTMTLVGRPIFGRGSPDEAPMLVTNNLYGGSFTSRLNMNLREDKGYTYGAGSQIAYRIGAGSFLAYSALRADATGLGLAEFFKELEGLITKPPAEDEVTLAKDGLILALPGQFERLSAAATAASSIFVYELPLDYYVGLVERIQSVDPAKVKEMAQKHLDPKVMTVLLVGDAAGVKAQVEKLGLGAVVLTPAP